MVLGIIGATIAIMGAAEANDVRKGFMNSDQKKQFDQENARDGIHLAEIDRIASRCKVKTNKWGTLPTEGYHKCLSYVRKYANSPDDVDMFIRMWKRHVQEQIVDEPGKIKAKYGHKYDLRAQVINNEAKTMDRNNLMTYEITHWRGLPKHLHLKRMEEIATKTCMSKILAQKPILRWSVDIPNTYTEYWTIYGQPGERFNNWQVRKSFEGTYKDCCYHLGYDPEL